MPKGYWVAHVTVNDPLAYEAYRRANAAAFDKYGGRFLVRGSEGRARKIHALSLDLLPGGCAFHVADAQQVRGQADGRVLLGAAVAVGQRHVPQRADNLDPPLQGDAVLDGAREPHGVRGLGLDHLGGGTAVGRRGRVQVATARQQVIDPAAFGGTVPVIGPRDPDQQGGDGKLGILRGQGLVGCVMRKEAGQQVTEHDTISAKHQTRRKMARANQCQ